MPRIAIITRTKNRPLLLRRCAESLLRQETRDLLWVVVNDGGDREPVDAVARFAAERGFPPQVLHFETSGGVSAAANRGIQGSVSEFVHLHDDDDTVAPGFYRSVLKFLDDKPRYAGVATSTNLVEEEVAGDKLVFRRQRPLLVPDDAICLSDMFNGNIVPTIAFVYRRAALDAVGLYDETLPVLEDWDFNLRFIRKYDIGGMPELQANYHWRVGSGASGTAQTATSGSHLHREYTTLIRNRLLRDALDRGELSFGALAAQGRNQQLSMDLLRVINDRTASQMWLRRLVKRVLAKIRVQ